METFHYQESTEDMTTGEAAEIIRPTFSTPQKAEEQIAYMKDEDQKGTEWLAKYKQSEEYKASQAKIIEVLAKYRVNVTESECAHFANKIEVVGAYHILAALMKAGLKDSNDGWFIFTSGAAVAEKGFVNYSDIGRAFGGSKAKTFIHEQLHLMSNHFNAERQFTRSSLAETLHGGAMAEYPVNLLEAEITGETFRLAQAQKFFESLSEIAQPAEFIKAAFDTSAYEDLKGKAEERLGPHALNILNIMPEAADDLMAGKKIKINQTDLERLEYSQEDVANPLVEIVEKSD